jgi:hypothetical protein
MTLNYDATNTAGLNDFPADWSVFGYLNRVLEFLDETCVKTGTLILVKTYRLQVLVRGVLQIARTRMRQLSKGQRRFVE